MSRSSRAAPETRISSTVITSGPIAVHHVPPAVSATSHSPHQTQKSPK
jgi:hypothetical protein